MEKLIEFAKLESERLRSRFDWSDKEFALLNTIKLGEEVGEVNNEVLKYFKCGRNNKLEEKNELSNEIADVMVVCAVLAGSMSLDLNEAIEKKIKIIEERHKNGEYKI